MLPILLAIEDENDRNFVAGEYEKYRERLYATALQITNNKEDAEDAAHNTILILIDCLQRYRVLGRHEQARYLKRCCVNVAIRIYNENKKRNSYEVSMTDEEGEGCYDIPDDAPSIADMAVTREKQQYIIHLLEQLKPSYADVLYFKCFIGMENDQIARMMGITENALTVRYHRARNKLLEEKGEDLYDILTT